MTKNIKGLSLEEVRRSKERHGDNSLVKEKNKSFLRKFIENLNDPIIKVLIFALIIEKSICLIVISPKKILMTILTRPSAF